MAATLSNSKLSLFKVWSKYYTSFTGNLIIFPISSGERIFKINQHLRKFLPWVGSLFLGNCEILYFVSKKCDKTSHTKQFIADQIYRLYYVLLITVKQSHGRTTTVHFCMKNIMDSLDGQANQRGVWTILGESPNIIITASWSSQAPILRTRYTQWQIH